MSLQAKISKYESKIDMILDSIKRIREELNIVSEFANTIKSDEEETTCHIYNGGSFSPVTLSHQQICRNTVNFLMDYLKDTPIDKIVLHIAPTSDLYQKQSVGEKCVSFEERKKLLENIIDDLISSMTPIKKSNGLDYRIEIKINDIEQVMSHIEIDGKKNGYMGTYSYLAEFSKDKIKENIYLLYGLDNINSLVLSKLSDDGTKINRWSNPIHLVSQFKFLANPRYGQEIDYEKVTADFRNNIELFRTNSIFQKELNVITGENNLEDISKELMEFDSNPIEFMKKRFIKMISIVEADVSSSYVRKHLYNYEDFNIKPDLIEKVLSETINPKNISTVKSMYKNGKECEGVDKFLEIKSGISIDDKVIQIM